MSLQVSTSRLLGVDSSQVTLASKLGLGLASEKILASGESSGVALTSIQSHTALPCGPVLVLTRWEQVRTSQKQGKHRPSPAPGFTPPLGVLVYPSPSNVLKHGWVLDYIQQQRAGESLQWCRLKKARGLDRA